MAPVRCNFPAEWLRGGHRRGRCCGFRIRLPRVYQRPHYTICPNRRAELPIQVSIATSFNTGRGDSSRKPLHIASKVWRARHPRWDGHVTSYAQSCAIYRNSKYHRGIRSKPPHTTSIKRHIALICGKVWDIYGAGGVGPKRPADLNAVNL